MLAQAIYYVSVQRSENDIFALLKKRVLIPHNSPTDKLTQDVSSIRATDGKSIMVVTD